MTPGALQIVPATQPWQVEQVRTLVLEYAAGLGISLDFQDFAQEMSEFPADYVPPQGALFLATGEQGPAGCVGLRPLEPGICEMKRLYVRASHRGLGLGQQLARIVIAEARALGYAAMRLDTLSHMHAAIALYQSLGFQPVAPYYDNPIPGALFFERRL